MVFLILVLCFTHLLYSQNKTVELDSSNRYLSRINLVYGCLDYDPVGPDYQYVQDSMLRDFFHQIEKNGFYDMKNQDTTKVLIDLLQRVKDDSTKLCLLPYYRILDPKANEIYRTSCYVSPMVYPLNCYCDEMPARYVFLFYIHLSRVVPIKLSEKESIVKFDLCKDGACAPRSLNQEDYAKLYALYLQWLQQNDSKLTNPLRKSGYYWNVEIAKVSKTDHRDDTEQWKKNYYKHSGKTRKVKAE